MFSKSQTAFGKKFSMGESLARLYAAAFLRDPMGVPHASNVTKQYHAPLTEVRVHTPLSHRYTVVNVNPYTLEEQLILYPFVVVSAERESSQPENVVVSFK